MTHPVYQIDGAGDITASTVTKGTPEAATDVNGYKYLIGTIHHDEDDFELYKTVEVLEEVFGDDD